MKEDIDDQFELPKRTMSDLLKHNFETGSTISKWTSF